MTRNKETPTPDKGPVPHAANHDTTPGRQEPISANDAELLAREIIDAALQDARTSIDSPALVAVLEALRRPPAASGTVLDYALDIASHRPGCITGNTECYACQVQTRQAVGS